MKEIINILITSVGRRTRLLEYFKQELKGIGKLIAVDCSRMAPALYIADRYYIVPPIDDPEYINVIKEICRRDEITAVLSLIDPELSLLAMHRDEFENMGVDVILSSYKACELFLDKYAAYKFFRDNGFRAGKTCSTFSDFENALTNNQIGFPVFIKPQRGSASQNISKVGNLEEARIKFKASRDMIIQEFFKEQEYGADVYIDMISGKVISIFVKEKLAMRAGETDKARSIKSKKLFGVIEDLVTKSNLVGPVDVDIFIADGEYYISEINPRFGGGYPLAFECGCNFPRYIINNLRGEANEPDIGNYEENVYMMKHDTLTIKRY